MSVSVSFARKSACGLTGSEPLSREGLVHCHGAIFCRTLKCQVAITLCYVPPISRMYVCILCMYVCMCHFGECHYFTRLTRDAGSEVGCLDIRRALTVTFRLHIMQFTNGQISLSLYRFSRSQVKYFER